MHCSRPPSDQIRPQLSKNCVALFANTLLVLIVRYYLLPQNNLSFKARRMNSAYKFVNSEVSSCLRNIIICLFCLAVLHVRINLLVPRSNNSLATAVRSQAKYEYVLFYILHSTFYK